MANYVKVKMIANVTEDDNNSNNIDDANDRTLKIRLFEEFRYLRVSK